MRENREISPTRSKNFIDGVWGGGVSPDINILRQVYFLQLDQPSLSDNFGVYPCKIYDFEGKNCLLIERQGDFYGCFGLILPFWVPTNNALRYSWVLGQLLPHSRDF